MERYSFKHANGPGPSDGCHLALVDIVKLFLPGASLQLIQYVPCHKFSLLHGHGSKTRQWGILWACLEMGLITDDKNIREFR